ncbi:MAG: ATP-binding protein [Bacteroidia bacterium]
MKKSTNKSKPLFIFYLLVAYVFVQFGWWSYLMVQQTNEIHAQKAQLIVLKLTEASQIFSEQQKLEMDLHRRWWMISGEGSVFLVLMILGISRVQKTFKAQTALANLQKNFLLSVTHELKSPIASAKLLLQTLHKRDLPKEQQKEIISNAIDDADRLDNLVENILLATNIENNLFVLHKEKINFSDLLEELVQKLSTLYKTHTFEKNSAPEIFFSADKMALSSIVLNLVENAVKYSPEKSTIFIVLVQKGNQIIFSVKDEGVGISDTEKEKIFNKFYRVGNENTRKTKGTGLGLYIVKNLVDQHSGIISVKNNFPKGSILEVTFDV